MLKRPKTERGKGNYLAPGTWQQLNSFVSVTNLNEMTLSEAMGEKAL